MGRHPNALYKKEMMYEDIDLDVNDTPKKSTSNFEGSESSVISSQETPKQLQENKEILMTSIESKKEKVLTTSSIGDHDMQ